MNLPKLKNFIYKDLSKDNIKLLAGLVISITMSIVFYIFQSFQNKTPHVLEKLQINLTVMIPKGHVLYPFEASNFEHVEPLLDAYNMVQVHHPKNGKLIAKNIKILRAPKSPSHLAFIIPVNIANRLAPFGLEFKIVVQKHINKGPVWMLQENKTSLKNTRLTTFGE